MVCKEDVVTWFKESSSYKRIDLMCSLLNMCIPFELRFLGTCVEDLGKRDFHDLREAENRANSLTVLTELRSVSDKRTRRNVAIYLSLLHSSNHGCSNELYRILSSFDCSEINNVSAESDLDDHPLDELLLLYTMAINHPAFTYEQKRIFEDILLKLQEEENKVCLTNNVLILVKSPLQEMDPAMLTCGANQNAYVRPYITPIAAIPVACAPDRKGNPTHETDNGSHASITRNGPTASPQPMFLTCVRPSGYPMQHTRQLHLEESSLPVTVNCRSVPSPAISPTHAAHPLDDSTVQIPCANSSTPPPAPTSSPTVVSARGPRRRPQSSSPGVGDASEHEMAPRVSRGHRGGGNSQRRPATSPRRHNVRGRGGIEQREIKEIPRYGGAQLGDADEGPEESSTVDSDATDSQQNADQSDAQHITNCLVPSVLAPPLPLSDAAPKVNDAAHLNNSSPPTPQLEEAPLPKGRLCPLEEGGNSNLIENRPQQPHVGEARPEVSPDEEVTVQSMQWVRAAPGTATGMPPRQPCLPHARPAMQRAAFSGGVTNCSSAGGRGDHGMAPVPSSPSSAFSSSSSLSSSSSSSSSGVSPQPPPPVPPTSSVPYTPPSVPPPYLPPPHLMAPPPHTLRFSTTFTTGYLPTSGGSGVGNNGGGGPAPPTPVGTAGSYLTPRHSFAFAPNGLAPTEIMYAATAPPPPQYHAGHHPRVGGAPGPVMDHSGQAIITQPGYPQYIPTVLLTSRAKGNTCYNCGGRTHRGGECRELTMEEITRPGGYRLEYSRQKGALVSGSGAGTTPSSGGGGDNAGAVDE